MKASEVTKKIGGYLDELADEVDDIEQNERFQKWMELKAQFYNYSFYNSMSIMINHPGATWVKGFRQWTKLKRFVKKGEKGIPILVPMFFNKPEAETDDEGKILRFKVAYVFDISQTEGEDIDTNPDLPDTDLHAREYQAVIEYSLEKGLTLNENAVIAARGNISKDGDLNLRAGLSIDAKAKVAIHELAHWELDHLNQHDSTTQQTRELEAEATTYIVGKLLGLPVDGSEIYLASYKVTGTNLKSAMERISGVVTSLHNAISERV